MRPGLEGGEVAVEFPFGRAIAGFVLDDERRVDRHQAGTVDVRLQAGVDLGISHHGCERNQSARLVKDREAGGLALTPGQVDPYVEHPLTLALATANHTSDSNIVPGVTIDSPLNFQAELTAAERGNATGIVVPDSVVRELGHGKRPPVRVSLNGYEFRTTLGTMAGRQMIPVSAAVRAAAAISAGDLVSVSLTVDTTPREAVIPEDLQAAFVAHPAAAAFFGTLSPSLQRFHVDNIDGAKTPETRARRIDKAIGLFLAGRPR